MFEHTCKCGAKFAGSKQAVYCQKCRLERNEQKNYRALLKKYGIIYPNICANCGIVISGHKRFCDDCAYMRRLESQRRYENKKRARIAYIDAIRDTYGEISSSDMENFRYLY